MGGFARGRLIAICCLAQAAFAACGQANTTPITPPPPPPAPPPPPPPSPIPLSAQLTFISRNTAILHGGTAPDDSVTIAISGDGATAATWSASTHKSWNTLLTASGVGSGKIRWHRNATSLSEGTYVDTLNVTVTGLAGAPLMLIDSLVVSAAPIPQALLLGAASRKSSAAIGSSDIADSVAVIITGTGANATTWAATNARSFTSLTTSSGAGSGIVRWTRHLASLVAGSYIDTLRVNAGSIGGSPALFVDTLVITAPPPTGDPLPDLGANASFHGRRLFPASDPWNQRVDGADVDPNSLAILSKVGLTKSLHPDFFANFDGGPYGIPYIVVADNTPRYNFLFDDPDESDPGPYPVPPNPPIEGNGEGDSHLLVITQSEFKLYETFATHFVDGHWTAGSGAIFDLLNGTQRPQYWTSADAAGLPIFPGLVRGDEVVEQGEINHALRFTVTNSRRAFVAPATHWASAKTDPLLPPMGMRVRLKASVNISGYSTQAQVILRALKKYGMIVADNGGDFFLSGAPDVRWDDDGINGLKQIKVGDFEVIKMVGVVSN